MNFSILNSFYFFFLFICATMFGATISGERYWGYDVVWEIGKTFYEKEIKAHSTLTCDKCDDIWYIKKFTSKKCDILFHYVPCAVSVAPQQMKKTCGVEGAQFFCIGVLRVAVIVNPKNPTNKLTNAQILRALFAEIPKQKAATWKEFGLPDAIINRYCDSDLDGWAYRIVNQTCMNADGRYGGPQSTFWGWNFDTKYFKNEEGVIKAVINDPHGIGFVVMKPEFSKLLKKVKILAIAKDEKSPYITPTLEPIMQWDYPLTEALNLYLHPKAPALAKEFCEFAIGPEGAKIAAKFGLITPYAEKQYLAEKYVKMMKAGEGPAVGMSGPVSLRMLANGLALESVKANGPVQFKFTDANESTAINSFLNRDDVYMLLLDSKPSERTMKLVAASWKKVQPVEYIIGGEAMAVIVNPANTATSLTPDQIRGLFSRQIKDWRFVAAKTAEGNGTARVECFGERLNTPAAQLFIDTVMPSSKIVGVKYRKTAGGVIASVAMDAGGVGFANAAMIDPEDKAVRIVPIGLQEKSVLPTEETIMNGQYPFSRKLYLYVKPNAPEAVKTIVKFILSPQAAEGFKANGYFPVPQPKPAPQTQSAKPTTQPVTPATTQPTTKPVTPTIPATQSAPKAA